MVLATWRALLRASNLRTPRLLSEVRNEQAAKLVACTPGNRQKTINPEGERQLSRGNATAEDGPLPNEEDLSARLPSCMLFKENG